MASLGAFGTWTLSVSILVAPLIHVDGATVAATAGRQTGSARSNAEVGVQVEPDGEVHQHLPVMRRAPASHAFASLQADQQSDGRFGTDGEQDDASDASNGDKLAKAFSGKPKVKSEAAKALTMANSATHQAKTAEGQADSALSIANEARENASRAIREAVEAIHDAVSAKGEAHEAKLEAASAKGEAGQSKRLVQSSLHKANSSLDIAKVAKHEADRALKESIASNTEAHNSKRSAASTLKELKKLQEDVQESKAALSQTNAMLATLFQRTTASLIAIALLFIGALVLIPVLLKGGQISSGTHKEAEHGAEWEHAVETEWETEEHETEGEEAHEHH